MGKSVAELDALRERGRRDLEDWKRRNCTPEDFERGRRFLEYLRSTRDGEDEAEAQADADEAGEGQGVLTEAEVIGQLEKRFKLRKHARLKSPAILASKARLRLNRRDKAIAKKMTRPMAEREPIGYVAGVRPSHT